MQNLALSSQFSNSGRRGSSSSNSFNSIVLNGVLPPSEDGRVEGIANKPNSKGRKKIKIQKVAKGYSASGEPDYGDGDGTPEPEEDNNNGSDGDHTDYSDNDTFEPYDPNDNNDNNNNDNNNDPPDIIERRNNSGNPHNTITPEGPAGDNLGRGNGIDTGYSNNTTRDSYYDVDERGNRIWVVPGGHWIINGPDIRFWTWVPKPKPKHPIGPYRGTYESVWGGARKQVKQKNLDMTDKNIRNHMSGYSMKIILEDIFNDVSIGYLFSDLIKIIEESGFFKNPDIQAESDAFIDFLEKLINCMIDSKTGVIDGYNRFDKKGDYARFWVSRFTSEIDDYNKEESTGIWDVYGEIVFFRALMKEYDDYYLIDVILLDARGNEVSRARIKVKKKYP